MITAQKKGRRSYGQACNIALTLDLVGERWTLLVARELATGSRSYSQLEEALPGIGTNLLATRLKQLESDGLVKRERPPGMRRRRIYRLTGRGRLLEPLLVEMERFGMAAGLRGESSYLSIAAWAVLSSRATFRPGAAGGLTERYEFHVGEEVFYLGVRDGKPDNGRGPAGDPAVTAGMTAGTFDRLRSGNLKMAQGVWTGEIEVLAGHGGALDRCEQIFGLSQSDPVNPGRT